MTDPLVQWLVMAEAAERAVTDDPDKGWADRVARAIRRDLLGLLDAMVRAEVPYPCGCGLEGKHTFHKHFMWIFREKETTT